MPKVAGKALVAPPQLIAVEKLLLNPANPRLPPSRPTSQGALLRFFENHYDPVVIARSIALHGFFSSEPLIAQPKGRRFVVLEGNRRLAALRILTDPELGRSEDRDEWESLSKRARRDELLPDAVPVIVTNNPKAINAILGYRHISGIEGWEPYNRAKFVAELVEKEKTSFEDIALVVGELPNEIRSLYRNFAILRQARAKGVNVSKAIDNFGIFTRALNATSIRSYIGAPMPKLAKVSRTPLSPRGIPRLRRLLGFLYGVKGSERVIGESRDLTTLGHVLASPTGRAVLEKTGDLEDAYEAAGGYKSRLLGRLARAQRNLRKAREDLKKYRSEPEVRELILECEKALDILKRTSGLD